MKTDGSHSLEENMRQTLLACYQGFADFLKQMAITHVCIYVHVQSCKCGYNVICSGLNKKHSFRVDIEQWGTMHVGENLSALTKVKKDFH